MKIWSVILPAVLALTLTLAGTSADARRLGGGSSFGKQSSNVTQRQAAPTGVNSAAKPATPAAAPAPVAPKKPWGAMLGGLAAGLGLAWLANSLGLGAAFGQVMMFALLALVVMLAVGWFMRSRRPAQGQTGAGSPFAFQGASNANV